MFSLIAVLLICSLGAGLIQLQSMTERRQSFAIDRRRALYLAEAGLGEAALAVSLGKSGLIASKARPASFGAGVYWVDSDDLPDDRMVLTCTAQVGSAEIVAQTLVMPNVNPVARLGFFGSQGVELGAGTIIDGYHSGRGSYASQVDPDLAPVSTGELGLVGSDHDVILLTSSGEVPPESETGASEEEWRRRVSLIEESEGPLSTEGTSPTAEAAEPDTKSDQTWVFGEIRPGHSAFVGSDGSAVVTGGIRPHASPPLLPEISLPTPMERMAEDLVVRGLQVGVGSSSQVDVVGTITVEPGATLRVEGPTVIVANYLLIAPTGTVTFDDTSGPIQVFLRHGIEFQPGSFLNSVALEALARGTRIFVAGDAEPRDRVALAATGTFHGLLYAPDDVVRVPASLRWIGGIAARFLETEPGTRLTVDRRLAIGGDGLPTLPELLAWQLVPMGDSIARELSLDPVMALRLRGITPLEPGEASPEDHVTLQYVDGMGQPTVYTGSITAFDPAGATEVVGARWNDPRDGVPRAWATPPGTDSTNATARVRADLAAIRTIVLRESPGTDVSSLSSNEAVLALVTLPGSPDLSGAPTFVDRALAREEGVEDPAQAEIDRAARAARSAQTMAVEARSLADAALARAEALDDDAARALAAKVTNEADKTEVHAEDARQSAIAASTVTGDAVSAEADDAESNEAKALADLERAKAKYAEFVDAGF